MPRPTRVKLLRRRHLGICVCLGVCCMLVLPGIMRWLRYARERNGHPATVRNSLKQMGQVFKMYANENDGLYPPLTRYGDLWMFDLECVYPEYLTDLYVLQNPHVEGDADLNEVLWAARDAGMEADWEKITRLAARNFTYTGVVMQSDDDALAVASNRSRISASTETEDRMLADRGIHRLRREVGDTRVLPEGDPWIWIEENPELIDTFLTGPTSPESFSVVMFENVASERTKKGEEQDGYLVLYQNGYVERIRFGERFPITQAVAAAFPPPKDPPKRE